MPATIGRQTKCFFTVLAFERLAAGMLCHMNAESRFQYEATIANVTDKPFLAGMLQFFMQLPFGFGFELARTKIAIECVQFGQLQLFELA